MTPLSFAWQLPQIALGAVVSAAPIISSKAVFEDKKICFWHSNMGMSLGHYIFLPEQLSEIPVDDLPAQAIFRHEFGHTIQSSILGPAYLIAVGLPSVIWAHTPPLKKMRASKNISYYDFTVEKDATRRGEGYFADITA